MNWLRIGEIAAAGAALMLLAGCGNNSLLGSSSSSSSSSSSTPVAISLSSSLSSVKTDGSESATLTARVVDSNNAAVSGANVSFSASAGILSKSSVTTDDSGSAQVTLTADAASPTNTTATVTASVSGKSTTFPVQIAGSTVTIAEPTTTTLAIGGSDSVTLTVTAKDSSGDVVQNVPVTLSTSGTGTASLGSTSGTTNSSGQFSTTLTAASTGTVTVTANALGDVDSKEFTVETATEAFQISNPTSSTVTIGTGVGQGITVKAPDVATTQVTFVSSHGVWGNGQSLAVQTVNATTREATDTLTASEAGTATVQVFDSNDSSKADSLTAIVVSTTVDANSKISLQANRTTIPVRTTDTEHSTTVTATVTDAANDPISGAAVVFTLSNTTGGGEYVTPSYGTTDSSGKVSTTFYSGTNASDAQGVTVTGELYDSSNTKVKTSSISIGINQQAASVVISTGTKISSTNNDVSYSLPMAVQVADSQGNPVANQTVTLKSWPLKYSIGYWDHSTDPCVARIAYRFDNEDQDRDNVLDSGEDRIISEPDYDWYQADGTKVTGATGLGDVTGDLTKDGAGNVTGGVDLVSGKAEDALGAKYAIGDGLLNPGLAAGGTLPSSVTTDENGIGVFDLVYLKAYAVWVTTELTATTLVDGTETVATLRLPLGIVEGEECNLSNSPFNPAVVY